MAWDPSTTVSIGAYAKASDHNKVSANADWLQTKADAEHHFDVVSGDGKHKAMSFKNATDVVKLKAGTAALPSLTADGDLNTGLWFPAADTIALSTGGSERVRIGSAGAVFIGDSANTNMTTGLTLNQGGNDDHIFALKSFDVAHGITDKAETDTYFDIQKISGTTGGANLQAYSEISNALNLNPMVSTEDTTDTTSSSAALVLRAELKSGTGVGVLGATGNLFTVTNAGTVRMLFKGDGALHATNITAGSGDLDGVALDGEDDIGLIRAFERLVHNDLGIVMSEWDEELEMNRADLERVGVFKGDFYCLQRMDSLFGGCIVDRRLLRELIRKRLRN